MGPVRRLLVALAAAAAFGVVGAGSTAAFDGFGQSEASSTYGAEMRFEVELEGEAPERLELLLETPGDDATFVVPLTPGAGAAAYVWDTEADYVTPNTLVTYRWRAIDGDEATVSEPATLRYEDDRPGLDWQHRQLGEATVHWYGDAESQALRFGELTAVGVEGAEALLGTSLAGPVDVFVYDDRDDFFGALGPGAREWTGAAAYSELRTIFMWLGGGSESYLETAMVHEVTHIVFHDATDNPFHEPARWLNEGVATWLETSDAAGERSIVQLEAGGGGLFAFEAITEQFPLGERGGRLSYAQGTVMVDLIVSRYGDGAIAEIAAAYRQGASDAEALEAGTGVPAEELYATFYGEFGVDTPEPIAPEPVPPSDVERPPSGMVDRGGVEPGAEEPPGDAAPGEDAGGSPSTLDGTLVVGLVIVAALGFGAAVVVGARRRGAPR